MTNKQYHDDIRYLKRYGTKKWVDINDFVKEMMSKHSDLTIHVGTDSQFSDGVSHYVTVVALRFGKRGVIGLYQTYKCGLWGQTVDFNGRRRRRKKRKHFNGISKGKKDRPAIQDRLRRETTLSITIAEYMKKTCNIPIDSIDLDYNSDDGGLGYGEKSVNISNDVVKECIGMCTGYGYKTTVKPESQVATPFADKLCRKY